MSGWVGYFDPGETLISLTTPEIGNLNEPYWSNAQYDKLALQQETAITPQQRLPFIWQMQQVMYQQTPWVVLDYPDNLEAYNTAKWTGWAQQFDGTGPVWQSEGYIATYLDLRPATATAASSGGSNAGLIAAVVVVVAAAAVVAVTVLRRRGRRAEEER